MRHSLTATLLLLLCCLPVLADEAPRVSIEGRVVDPEERPVADAQVTICWLDQDLPAALTFPAAQELLAADMLEMSEDFGKTATQDDGRFTVDLPEGRTIGINVVADGFAPFRAYPVAYSGTAVIRLERGRPARVRVTDAAGREPVAGARVVAEEGITAMAPSTMGVRKQKGQVVTAITDDRGWATLPNLGDAPYALSVEADGRVPVQGILLRAGASMSLRTVRASSVSGLVTDEEGRPVTGARVEAGGVLPEAQDVNGSNVGFPFAAMSMESKIIRRQATTDDEGLYRIDGLPPDTEIAIAVTGDTAGVRADGATKGPGEDNAVDIELPRTRQVAMTFVDADGEPVEGLRAHLRPRCDGDPEPVPRWRRYDPGVDPEERGDLWRDALVGDPRRETLTARSDEEGRAVFEARGPRCYTVAFNAEGFLPGERVIEVTDADALDIGDVTLDPAGTIAGRVLDFDDQPVPDLRLEITEEPAPPEDGTLPWDRPGAVSDEDGAFSIDGLPDGTYTVGLAEYGERFRRPQLWQAEPASRVKPGKEDVVLRLFGAAVVTTRVVDAESGKPLEGAWAVVTERRSGSFLGSLFGGGADTTPWQGQRKLTDDGRLRMAVPPGRHHVEIRRDGYLPWATVITAEADRATPIDEVALERGATIRGIVLGPDDQPLAGAQVGLADDAPFSLAAFEELMSMDVGSPPALASTVTDMAGGYTLTGVPAGTVRLRVYHTRCAPLDETLEDVAPGEVREGQVLRTHNGGAIEGTLTGKGGRPVGGAMVAAGSLQDVKGARLTTSDESGRFRLERLPAGNHYLLALPTTSPEDMALPEQVDVRPGETTRVRLASGGGIPINGRVTLAGAPLAGASLELAPIGSPLGGTSMGTSPRTGNDGSFRTMALSAGEYLVTVRSDDPPVDVALPLTIPGDGGALPDLRIPPTGRLEVEVTGPSGEPVSGARVTTYPGDTLAILDPMTRSGVESERATDEEGRVVFPGLGAGVIRVLARAEGLGSAVVSTTVRAGDKRQSAAVELPGVRTVSGKVVNEAGRPVRQALLITLEETGEAVDLERPGSTDRSGIFELGELPDRPMVLAVGAQGYGIALVPVADGEDELEIVLARAGGADVRLEGPSGERVEAALALEARDGVALTPGAFVGLQFLLGGSTLPDAEGWIRIRALAPGSYTLTALRGGREAGSTSLTIRADEISAERLRLP